MWQGQPFPRRCRSANSLICSLCSRPHLTTLCDIQRPAEGFEPARRKSEHSRSKRVIPETANDVTSASTSAAGPMPVLLQTGRSWGLGTSRSLLLDTRSQPTFIRRDVSRALACPVNGVERLTIATFGNTRPRTSISCSRVSLTLKSQHDGQHGTIDASKFQTSAPSQAHP